MSGANGNGALPELPDGWEWRLMGEIADCRLGKMLDKDKNVGELRPYLRNINVQWGRFDLDDVKEMRITDGEVERYRVEAGDLLVCEGGEPGRCAVWRDDATMFFQKALHRVRPRDGVLVDYLEVFFRFAVVSGRLTPLFTGTTIKHLPGVKLAQIQVPMPPVPEQRRIVAAVQRWFAAADGVEGSVRRAERQATEYEIAVTAAAFCDDTGAQPQGDRIVESLTLGELCAAVGGRIQTGPFGSQLHASDYRDDGTPVVMPRDLDYGHISTDVIARIGPNDAERLARHRLQAGDILQSRRGDLRRRALVTDEQAGWICGTGCFVIRLKDVELASFVMEHLAEPGTARFIDERAVGVTMPNLNREILASVPLRVPPSGMRMEVLRRMRSDVQRIRALRPQLDAVNGDVERLRRSVLVRACTGRLEIADHTLGAVQL